MPSEPGFVKRGWMSLMAVLAEERRSLRGRLLYTLLVLFLVLSALETQEHFNRLHAHRQLVARAEAHTAQVTADLFRSTLAHLYQAQAQVAHAALSGRLQASEATWNAFLEDLRDQYPGMVALQVYGADGSLKYSTPQGGKPPQLSADFARDLTTDSPHYLSPIYTDVPGGLPMFRVASRVEIPSGLASGGSGPDGTGDASSAVSAVVAMEFYAKALPDFIPGQGTGQLLLLVDGKGEIAHASAEIDARGVAASPAVRTAREQRREATVQVPIPGHADTLGYAAPIPDTDWTLVYLRPEMEASAEIHEGTRRELLLLMGVFLALGLAMVVVVRLSLKPLIRLSVAARHLGSGDLSFRIPPAEVQEFEPLVEAFNVMARQLDGARGELLEANRDLEQRVLERTEALEREHEKLLRAERLSTLGLLSSAIAHDLRNPLNTVGLAVHTMKARLQDRPDERLSARLETIERELKRAEEIISTLLAFARTGEPARQVTDVNEMVEEAAGLVHADGDVSVGLDLSPDLPCVPLDRSQMMQVLENLVRNAVQAVPAGGVVTVSSRVEVERLVLRIEDNGPGIPPELRNRVFEPLVTTKSTGTGLGLALCKRIVDAHGGSISVEEAAVSGAVFRIELPLV